MRDFLMKLFDADFVPHGMCYFWNPRIVWLHVSSDALIFLAYLSISCTLAYFVRRRKDLPFSWIFVMFAVFILGCGLTHLVEVWTVWHGTYRLAGVVKLVTALASVATAIQLVPLVPRALAIPSPEQLRVANERLARRTEELQRSNAELQRFAYAASHDLQEPLRAVASYTQLLARRYRGQLDRDADEFIDYAVAGAKRMQPLIADLLAYSRLDANPKGQGPASCEEALALALAHLRTLVRETGAEITHDPLPVVLADRAQLAQVFQNLMANALKYRNQAPPRVHVSARRQGPMWLLSVRDNGIGIDPQYAERIFLMFQRLHTSEKYPGTGMGLAICQKIVERHGGAIWLESEPGRGSKFYFTLPAPTEAASPVRLAEARVGSGA
jgi:signal transduction histidine kinase